MHLRGIGGVESGLDLSHEMPRQTMREHGSQITSYVVYGVTAEMVRRLVRRWL